MPDSDINIRDVSGQVAFAQVGGNLTGDIIAGNKTIITNIIQQAAKQIVTAPYKFLASYDISDRDIFFGRNAVIEQLVGNFPRFKTLVINGRSGSGKTSLINAGLIPRLAENGYHYISFREYSDPLRQLQEHVRQDDVFRPFADATGSLWQFLTTVTRQQHMPLVVIFDQFERFFVKVPAALRTQFIQEIKACLMSDLSGQELDLVFALREDFFGAFLIEFETVIPTFFHDADRFNLLPLQPDEAREAILNPLRRVAYKIGYDKAFVDDVLLPGLMGESSAGTAIDPPHLQIVCNQLYQAACERHAAELAQGDIVQIDRALYTHLGETSGILRTYLDDFIDRAAHRDAGGRDVLRSMLKLMLETTGTRKFVSFADLKTGLPDVLPTAIEQHIREFQDGRIIETRGQGEAARYSLSHEVMVEKVHSWFDERELERKKAQEILERGMAEWKATQALLNEKQVNKIRQWLASETVSGEAEQLLTQSQQAYEAQQRREAEQERRIRLGKRILWSVIVVAFVVASVLTFWALRNASASKIQALDALNTSAYSQFLAKQDELGSLLSAVKVGQQIKQANTPEDLQWRAAFNLRDIIEGIHEKNRFNGQGGGRSLSFSPDGRFLASGSFDATIKLWDVSTGRELKTLTGHAGFVRSVSFSPDGTKLVSGGADKTVKLWDVTTGQEIRTLTGHMDEVSSVRFSPDGAQIASGSQDRRIKLWNVTDGREIRTLTGIRIATESISFSPDGTRIASGGRDGFIYLWNVADGQQLQKINANTNWVYSLNFSPDGIMLASANAEQTISLWNVADGAEIRTWVGHSLRVFDVSFSPDGQMLASGSEDHTVKLWEVSTGREIRTFTGHVGSVYSVRFNPDGKLLASNEDARGNSTIKLWKLTSNMELNTFKVYSSFEETISTGNLCFSPTGKLFASGHRNGTITLWNTADGQKIRTFQRRSADVAVTSVKFNPDGQVLASGRGDGTITLWDVANGQELKTFMGHRSAIWDMSFSPDGRLLASGSRDSTIKLWDVGSSQEIRTFTGHQGEVFSVSFSPDGTQLASGSADTTIKLWNVADGREIRTIIGHTRDVFSLSFSPDGRLLASGSRDHTIKFWNVADGREIRTLKHLNPVPCVSFSPDGRWLVSSSHDQTIKLWNVADGREIRTFNEPVAILEVRFSPDGKQLFSGDREGTIKRWWIGDLDESLRRGCAWLQGYLKNNPTVSAEDRVLCDDILKNSRN